MRSLERATSNPIHTADIMSHMYHRINMLESYEGNGLSDTDTSVSSEGSCSSGFDSHPNNASVSDSDMDSVDDMEDPGEIENKKKVPIFSECCNRNPGKERPRMEFEFAQGMKGVPPDPYSGLIQRQISVELLHSPLTGATEEYQQSLPQPHL